MSFPVQIESEVFSGLISYLESLRCVNPHGKSGSGKGGAAGNKGVRLIKKPPASHQDFIKWQTSTGEAVNDGGMETCSLPEDLKHFLAASDGFKLFWKNSVSSDRSYNHTLPSVNSSETSESGIKLHRSGSDASSSISSSNLNHHHHHHNHQHHQHQIHQQSQRSSEGFYGNGDVKSAEENEHEEIIGIVEVNSLSMITEVSQSSLPTIINHANMGPEQSTGKPRKRREKIFLIQDCHPYGKVYMTLPLISTEEESTSSSCIISFHGTESETHFHLADSFTTYLRFMISCLGIKGWQLAFCPLSSTIKGGGWSAWTRDWMFFYCPEMSRLMLGGSLNSLKGLEKREKPRKADTLVLPEASSSSTISKTRALDMGKIAKTINQWKAFEFESRDISQIMNTIRNG